ncbi:MAG: S-methyl-5-thioribose-1-phosphate isomerase [Ignavibacteriales bacterium]|jgi:methylthioribose-1-phosphate isomerase|nr:MAG: S-methyl-5-thioribose-1-phosphate isomerase [Ignavibacterium sp.]MCZ7611330.1 S-methyl-5-thioribose-1-phosphate isomerase [Ignavibacterium sp.]MDX9712050.1 S-methyl-5-thioribose-1-phosphate isomerase [Ignavibacteriaceae bacterium]MEB2353791.1 S-methyl-5-thioribose-1-phosphate isomerase [Ignavibacteriales bacterium]
MNNYFAIKFSEQSLLYLDQTKLPMQEVYIKTDDYERIASAIERLELRGAPLIGISAAFTIAISFKSISADHKNHFEKVYKRLASTRPTAVNLFYALDRMKNTFENISNYADTFQILIKEAQAILDYEELCSKRISEIGSNIFTKKSNVLTHCNTGALAAAGFGTAFAVIKKGFDDGFVKHVYVDETRPLLQGLRLTAYELKKNEIPFTVLTDSMAAILMQQGEVDLVITGADRIALNGDSANKIGTYNLAVICNFHNIPFYIAAPSTTIDRKIAAGNEIEIEYRNGSEILSFDGKQITDPDLQTFSPAFDVTPAYLIKGIITEEDFYSFPYNFIK